jgi:hypothetical protein
MARRLVGLLLALGALLLIPGMTGTCARAAVHSEKHVVKSRHRQHEAAAKVGKHKRGSSPSLTIVTKAPNNAPDFDYQDRIQEAQALLASQPVLSDDMQFDPDGKLSHFVWTLAVGQKTGPLTVVRMDETGKNDRGFVITWPVDNFINTHFHVASPDDYIVFAQRRPVRVKDGYQEAVYTAYSPELDTKTMRDAGMDFLRHLQRLAYDHIKDQDVRSRVAPNVTVAQNIPTSMVLRLMITEHIDPLHMRYVGIEQCIHEILVTIAANRGHAYAYARSSAGALGLPQFMEDSYEMVRTDYPKALLEPNFELGMTDLPNAVLASVLLLDLELTNLPRDYLKRFTESSQQFAAFLAAGYNRNPVHVMQTYHRTHTFTGGNTPFESKMYVRIQSWVGSFLKKQYGIT